jgi:hypothetical protein
MEASLWVCANCERTGGKLETPLTWNGNPVCATCYTRLSPATPALKSGALAGRYLLLFGWLGMAFSVVTELVADLAGKHPVPQTNLIFVTGLVLCCFGSAFNRLHAALLRR